MICGVIQARTGSSRLPNKVLSKLGTMSVIEHLVKQVRGSRHIEGIILATSDLGRDDPLAAHAKDIGLKVYRGSEDKIMSRLLGAAEECGGKIVVRLLGDCPLSDPEVIDAFVEKILADNGIDMVTNQNPHSYPDGYDISVMRIGVLREACRKMAKSGEPEHLSAIWGPDSGFNVVNVQAERNYFKDYRLTLDYEKDLQAIRCVVEGLGGNERILYLRDVLGYLKENPGVAALNKEYIE